MRITVLVSATVALIGASVAVGAAARQSAESAVAAARPTNPAPELISGYRRWTRVNPRPYAVPAHLAALCRSLTPQEKAEVAGGPHKNKWVTVYVNAAARSAMLTRRTPAFPAGSLIVKEKLPKPGSRAPELLTVLRKRESGYDAANGDWEYLVFDGPGTRAEAQGRLPECRSCHTHWKETDYVSRAYLPDAVRRQLR